MKNMEHCGDAMGYQVYRNSDGFLEGFKSIGEKSSPTSRPNANNQRVITNAKDMQGFINFIVGMKSKPAKVKSAPMPKLFDDTTL